MNGEVVWIVSCDFGDEVHGWYIETYLIWLNVISFLVFGGACFVARYMRDEYQRYGVARYRIMVGALQVLGAAGMLAGFWLPWLGQFSAAGLALLMLCGVVVRLKIKDTLWQTMPAAVYMLLSGYIAWVGY